MITVEIRVNGMVVGVEDVAIAEVGKIEKAGFQLTVIK